MKRHSSPSALTSMRATILLAILCLGISANGWAQTRLRVATWNVTNYGGANATRDAAFRTVLYGTFEGRQFAPDVLVGQEFTSQSGVNAFLLNLNTAAGSPGGWAAAPFEPGPDTTSAFFYRTGLVEYVATTVVYSATGDGNEQPRDTLRYDLRVRTGGTSTSENLSIYSLHLKSGANSDDGGGDPNSGPTNGQRRLLETNRVRADANALPNSTGFLVVGDFNIASSNEAAYQSFINSQADNSGQAIDPIRSPGSWQNSNAFRYLHTQDPTGAGGMDDRFDQILISRNLADGAGSEYIGNTAVTFSNSTWNDPNHSYRVWGNDGTSFNMELRTTGNAQVGETIAQALKTSVGTGAGGHLPVYADFDFVGANVPELGTLPLTGVGLCILFVGAVRRRRGRKTAS